MKAYKVVSHDYCPPIQGGDPIYTTLPHVLPEVAVDMSDNDCGAGWNFCAEPETALRIAGLWRDGRPAILLECEIPDSAIRRKDKIRAGIGDLVREIDISDEILSRLHAPMVGDGLLIEDIVSEVQAWRHALARPGQNREKVMSGLRAALTARGLAWELVVEYPTARDAWAARDARAAWAAWDARAAWAAWDARAARAARDAWDAWAARAARDAWDALTVYVASRRGWTQQDPGLLTVGIREAYSAGLGIAIPVPGGLGWAMSMDGAK